MKDETLQEAALIDEMRRRGRRRLIGAVVLALCAVIFVPMLLEKEPAPLGDNVDVVIPSQDTRLPGTSTPSSGNTAPSTPPATSSTPPVEIPPPPAPPVAPPVEPTPPAPTPPVVTSPPKPAADTKPTVKPDSAPAAALPPTVAPAKGTFSVQLAAFTDDKGANTLVNKLKRAGYPAYTEPSDTARGMVWRVRVGAYKTRDTAMSVRERLRKEGYDSMVAPAR